MWEGLAGQRDHKRCDLETEEVAETKVWRNLQRPSKGLHWGSCLDLSETRRAFQENAVLWAVKTVVTRLLKYE